MSSKGGPGTAAKLGGLLGIGCVLLVFVVLAREGARTSVEPGVEMSDPGPHGLGRVRVEVLNAGGVGGLAKVGRDEARAAGFDVVYFGNAQTFDQDSSVVLDRVGDMEMARAVARALRIDNVRSEPDPNLFLDVSVLLGSSWKPQSQSR